MYGLQIRNDDEVSEISEYIGNLSGFDGQNFNPVVTTEAPTGYGVEVNGQKIILQNNDTFVLRHLRTAEASVNYTGNFFNDYIPPNTLPVVRVEADNLAHLYVLDRVNLADRQGQYGLQQDSRIFAPVQKPVTVRTDQMVAEARRGKVLTGYRGEERTFVICSVGWPENLFANYYDLREACKNWRFTTYREAGLAKFESHYLNRDTPSSIVRIYTGIR